jgi:hypothetical protein
MKTHYSISNEEAAREFQIQSKSQPICYGARVCTMDPEPTYGTFICVTRSDDGDRVWARIFWEESHDSTEFRW